MARAKDISPLLKEYDSSLLKDGKGLLMGIDEAGRGPLAGPVVAACAVFPETVVIPYVNDSKKLSQSRREALYEEILEKATAVGVGIVDNVTIDKINILNATKEAMKRAVNNTAVKVDIILVDAVDLKDMPAPVHPIVKGDAKSFAIAAASIIAKVTRDRLMAEYDEIYPGYNFSSHKGYGTKAHYDAIRACGISPIHRKSFLKTLH